MMERKRIVLLHGWDWAKYPKFRPAHQWQNRQAFVDALNAHFDVDYPSLPGFDPVDTSRTGSWTLDDYAAWLDARIGSSHYDAVIGYSFGCAVATRWSHSYPEARLPLILISPAIARAYTRRPSIALGTVARAVKHIGGAALTTAMREMYLGHWVKNPFVIHGTPFLRRTYSNIVGQNLAPELSSLLRARAPVSLVFGAADTATPPEVLFAQVPEARGMSRVLDAGTHDIGTTHVLEIVDHVIAFLRQNGVAR